MARDEAARDATEEASLVDRRSYMKLFGVAATPIAVSGAAAESASAESPTGYGADGYGRGGYGESTTDSPSTTAPVIDVFEVSERGSRNPHAEINATWQVSDADGDLRQVAVEVRDADGTVRRSTSVGVSGESASGAPSFRIKKGGGATYDCVLEVTDAAGRTASRTRTVTA